MKTKRENEKDKERKDTTGINTSPHVVKTIMLTRAEIQIAPPISSSLSFSFPSHSKYLTSLIKKFRDDVQKPRKDSHQKVNSSRNILSKHGRYIVLNNVL